MNISGYELSAETVSFLKLVAEKFPQTYQQLTLEQARSRSLAVAKYFSGEFPFAGEISTICVSSPDVSDGIPLTVYKPTNLSKNPSILVYFHGGGYVVGSRETTDSLCRKVASDAKCIVLNVEYRLAPEHIFPACNDDAACVMRWVLQNKTKVGGSSDSTVGVAGDSAGGSISATVCHEVEGINYQILIYPKINSGDEGTSYKEFDDGPVLTHALRKWFMRQWLSKDANYTHVRCNPINRECDKLPPALFIVAECDPIRDDSYDYQKKLDNAGVETKLLLLKGTCHAFFHLIDHFKESCGMAITAVVEFINGHS